MLIHTWLDKTQSSFIVETKDSSWEDLHGKNVWRGLWCCEVNRIWRYHTPMNAIFVVIEKFVHWAWNRSGHLEDELQNLTKWNHTAPILENRIFWQRTPFNYNVRRANYVAVYVAKLCIIYIFRMQPAKSRDIKRGRCFSENNII